MASSPPPGGGAGGVANGNGEECQGNNDASLLPLPVCGGIIAKPELSPPSAWAARTPTPIPALPGGAGKPDLDLDSPASKVAAAAAAAGDAVTRSLPARVPPLPLALPLARLALRPRKLLVDVDVVTPLPLKGLISPETSAAPLEIPLVLSTAAADGGVSSTLPLAGVRAAAPPRVIATDDAPTATLAASWTMTEALPAAALRAPVLFLLAPGLLPPVPPAAATAAAAAVSALGAAAVVEGGLGLVRLLTRPLVVTTGGSMRPWAIFWRRVVYLVPFAGPLFLFTVRIHFSRLPTN